MDYYTGIQRNYCYESASVQIGYRNTPNCADILELVHIALPAWESGVSLVVCTAPLRAVEALKPPLHSLQSGEMVVLFPTQFPRILSHIVTL